MLFGLSWTWFRPGYTPRLGLLPRGVLALSSPILNSRTLGMAHEDRSPRKRERKKKQKIRGKKRKEKECRWEKKKRNITSRNGKGKSKENYYARPFSRQHPCSRPCS
ncbi:hypothetical protein QBC37DRAFT_425170 [Rhypophila decipiens]|uniref:Uncharacterized protein n=1 Tax=Rhypophila decipiens TaxID=261697 RepID=A0AAN6Y496_9PEZI|nr:hypothetical protein QBC37DRAFT_425170 [Rhypophila decipiens]